MDESAGDFVWQRVAADKEGRVYAAPSREEYLIEVWGPDGAPQRAIRCRYEARPRDDGQRDNARAVQEAIGAYYPVKPRRITIADTEPAVGALAVDDGGRLWVQTARSASDAPAGSWAVVDVFAPDGRLQKRVALPGDHDLREDALLFLGDGRFLVVKGSLAAFLSQQAVTRAGDAAEADPLEVICYRIEE